LLETTWFIHAHGNSLKAEFAQRLRAAMVAAGYEAKPSVLEREFNQRYWGRAVTHLAIVKLQFFNMRTA